MINVILAEALKLKRSLVILVSVTPPIMVFLLFTAIIADGHGASDWTMFTYSSAAIWAYFLMPMSIIGITALLAQIEHGPGTWSHTLALPMPRWQIFTAKALIAFFITAIVTVLVIIATLAASYLGGILSGDPMEGFIPWALIAKLYGLMLLASCFLMSIQWSIAMHFKNFAVPVSIGIAGTFVSVVATSSKYGLYFPWLMPVGVLAGDPDRAGLAVQYGSIGGLIIFAISIWSLSRKNWT
jgi:hypothetical protein